MKYIGNMNFPWYVGGRRCHGQSDEGVPNEQDFHEFVQIQNGLETALGGVSRRREGCHDAHEIAEK